MVGVIRTEIEQVGGEKWLTLYMFLVESARLWAQPCEPIKRKYTASLHFKMMHNHCPQIKVHQSRPGSKVMPKSSVKITEWYTLITTPKYCNVTFHPNARQIMEKLGYGGHHSRFSKFHLDIFKHPSNFNLTS